MTHRRFPCVCVEGDGGDSRPATTRGAGACRSRRNDFFLLLFLPDEKVRHTTLSFFRPKNVFQVRSKTGNAKLSSPPPKHQKHKSHSAVRTLPAELTHARETTPNEFFKAGRENSRLIDCCWSTFNDRNPIRAGDSRFHTTTQSNSTFINTLRCDSRRSAVLELCVCVLSKFSRPLNAH